MNYELDDGANPVPRVRLFMQELEAISAKYGVHLYAQGHDAELCLFEGVGDRPETIWDRASEVICPAPRYPITAEEHEKNEAERIRRAGLTQAQRDAEFRAALNEISKKALEIFRANIGPFMAKKAEQLIPAKGTTE